MFKKYLSSNDMKQKYLKYLYITIAAKLLLIGIRRITLFLIEDLSLLQPQQIELLFYAMSGTTTLVSAILILMVWVDRKTTFTTITIPALILFSIAISYNFTLGILLLIVANIICNQYTLKVTPLNLSQHLIDN